MPTWRIMAGRRSRGRPTTFDQEPSIPSTRNTPSPWIPYAPALSRGSPLATYQATASSPKGRKRARVWARAVLACCVALAVLVLAGRAHAGDPYLRWSTVVTPHFRVHFHGGLREVAERVANVAENAHDTLVPELGWEPLEVTHILVADDADSANGLASTLPYDFIRIFVSARL